MNYEKEIVAAMNHPDGKTRLKLWEGIIASAFGKRDYGTLIEIAWPGSGAPEEAQLSAGLSAIECQVSKGAWKIVRAHANFEGLLEPVKKVAAARVEEAALIRCKDLYREKRFMELHELHMDPQLPAVAKKTAVELLSAASFKLEKEMEEKRLGFIKRMKTRVLEKAKKLFQNSKPIRNS